MKENIEELQDSLLDCEVEENSDWKHYKGSIYTVLALSLDATSHVKLVTYMDTVTGYVWTRPLSEWLEMVDYEGKQVKRFQYVEGT